MRNSRSSSDARYALSGKDGAIFNKDGVLLASVDTFTSTASVTNAKYNPLGNLLDLETNVSMGVKITMSYARMGFPGLFDGAEWVGGTGDLP